MIDDDDPDADLDEAVSPETPVESSVEPKTYRTKSRELAMREAEREQFWRAVLASDVGRREMWGILQDAHFDADRFGVGPSGVPDLAATWLSRGEQAFGYRIFLTLLRHDRAGALRMLEEHDHRLARPEPPRRRRAG